MQRYPGIEVELKVSDRMVDLMDDKLDVAVGILDDDARLGEARQEGRAAGAPPTGCGALLAGEVERTLRQVLGAEQLAAERTGEHGIGECRAALSWPALESLRAQERHPGTGRCAEGECDLFVFGATTISTLRGAQRKEDLALARSSRSACWTVRHAVAGAPIARRRISRRVGGG